MSQAPTPYARQYNFETFSQQNPGTQQPGVQLDAEYNAILLTLTEVLSRLAEIQRDDGKLRNGIVGRDALSGSFASGVNPPAPWTPNTDYSETDSCLYNGSWYWSLSNHNSGGSFDAGQWQFIGTFFSENPLLLSLGQNSLVDGILSADTAGRAKMADGFVTLAKLTAGLTGGWARAWANFSPQYVGVNWSFTFSGSVVTATSLSGDLATVIPGFAAGSTITLSGGTGNNSILNGSWQILSFNGSTVITFDVGSTPAGPLSTMMGWLVPIFASYNIKTITRVSDGKFAVVFDTALANANYVVHGTTSTYSIPPYANLPRTVLGTDYSNPPGTSAFTLLCASWQQNVNDFTANNPDRVMFSVFGTP